MHKGGTTGDDMNSCCWDFLHLRCQRPKRDTFRVKKLMLSPESHVLHLISEPLSRKEGVSSMGVTVNIVPFPGESTKVNSPPEDQRESIICCAHGIEKPQRISETSKNPSSSHSSHSSHLIPPKIEYYSNTPEISRKNGSGIPQEPMAPIWHP